MFIQYDADRKIFNEKRQEYLLMPYTLNIRMKLAKTDLKKILEEKAKKNENMEFEEFF
jgi:hypothetical protein